jgi:hypothetical protein
MNTPPVFLLGAGFNRNAKRHAGTIIGHSIYCGGYEIECGYPLVADLARICFGRESLSETESIEELFAAATQEKNFDPLRRLYDSLMEADYRIIPRLLPGHGKLGNPYATFFDQFQRCQFLTFNYDSLPEVFLLQNKVWYPQDGYGVHVQVALHPLADKQIASRRSSSYVLHLHGSLCIYSCSFDLTDRLGSSVHWLVPKATTEYIFDPDSITSLFYPYVRMPPQPTGYEPIEHRVIAPVPDKAEELQQEFVRKVHSRATSILESCQQLVVIGYRFNMVDKSSYDHLLGALSCAPHPEAVLISPDAGTLKDQLSGIYTRIHWIPVAQTFEEWVGAGFPGAVSS